MKGSSYMERVYIKVNEEIKKKVWSFLNENKNKEKEYQPSSGEYLNIINELVDAIVESFKEQNKELSSLFRKLNYENSSFTEELVIKKAIYQVNCKYVRDDEADYLYDELNNLYETFYKK